MLTIPLFLIYGTYFVFMQKFSKRAITWQRGVLNLEVSLIIATYNEESTLPSKLKNVLELNYPKELLELVIIDSGSTDNTSDVVEEFIRRNPSVKVVFIRESERLGKSHALNIAYPRASGTIKVISDSDALLERDAINRLVSNFYDDHIGAACGRQVLLNAGENPTTRAEKSYRNLYEILRKGESILDSTPIFHGELSAYRSCMIESLPENKSADDSRLANVIRKKGFRSIYDSEAVFYEYAPPSSHSRTVQKVRRGQGLIRVFWDFKNCMFRARYGLYGKYILPFEFFSHCVFPAFWLFSISVLFIGLALFSWLSLLIAAVLLGIFIALGKLPGDNSLARKTRACASLFSSFFSSQVFLFYALLLWISGRSLHRWQKVEEIRSKWNPDLKVKD